MRADNQVSESRLGGLDESHFKHLFLTLAAIFFIVPVINEFLEEPSPLISRLLYLVVFGWVLFGAISIAKNRRILIGVIVLSVVAIVLNSLHIRWQLDGLLFVHHLLVIVVLGYFTVSLVRYLFVCKSVTINTIYAALCSYLLLSLMWALAYGLLDIVQPGSLKTAATTDTGLLLSESFQALYFSLVTITTLGYGDISPVTNAARGLATAEAFVGQMFIAITVARLVGIYTARTLMKDD